jgi:hypothetical protein
VPEYIPKPGIAPDCSDAKSVFLVVDDALMVVMRNTNDIKAIRVVAAPVTIHPGAGHPNDFPPLAPREGLKRAPEGRTTSRLHLHECHEVSPASHDVNFQPAHSEAMVENDPAEGLQEPDCGSLAAQPQDLAGISPICGI